MLWKHAIPTSKLGAAGERRAAWFYRLRGYAIVARNVRTRGGEIDLVVRRGRTLAFVEVKTRQSLTAGEGYDAVGARKQQQLVSLASAYLTRHPHRGDVRYDVLSLFWNGRRFVVTHFADAFRPVGDARRPGVKAHAIAFILAFVAAAGQSQSAADLKGRRFILYEENDIHLFSRVSGRDRHYTQGLKLQMLFPERKVASLIDRATRRLQLSWGGCAASACSSGWSLGQNIYTPQDISKPELQTDERPYAAWLYGGAVFEMRGEGIHRSLELDVGMIGPAALGRPIQTKWHDLIGVDPPRGWNNQLRNEPGIELHYNRRERREIGKRGPWSADFLDRRGGALGNIFAFANVTPTFRAGYNVSNEFFSQIPQPAPPLLPSPAPPMASAARADGAARQWFEWYVFAGADGRVILWNELLEGNCCVHSASHGVRHKLGVAMLDWGAAARVGWIRLTWRQIRRTREFEGQKKADIYGALSLVYDAQF
jgi:uncharacterized protein (TIGR00252 family)